MSYYWGALVGAYLAMRAAQLGELEWWKPLAWVACALALDGAVRLLKRAWRQHKRFRTESDVTK